MIINANEEAQVLLGNGYGERRATAIAMIIAPDGTKLFHLISTRWTRLVAFGYGLMLFIIVVLAMLIYWNKVQITNLQEKVDKDVPPVECCSNK